MTSIGEARALGSVRHPCIVDVLDAGITPENEPYVVLEMLRGRSLEGLLVARRRLSVADTVYVTRRITTGTGGGRIFRTTDAGLTWTDITGS